MFFGCQGFDADHRDIELLKLRNFTIGKKGLPDSVFTDEDGQDKISDIIRAMVGFVSHSARPLGACWWASS